MKQHCAACETETEMLYDKGMWECEGCGNRTHAFTLHDRDGRVDVEEVLACVLFFFAFPTFMVGLWWLLSFAEG